MTSRHVTFTAQARPIARVWWLATRRLWRENTILVALWAAFMAVYVYHVARPPVEGRVVYLLLLAAAALVTALLVPIPIGATSLFESRRFDLLPISPFALFLLRPAFGNSFRLLLLAPVWIGSAIGVLHVALGPLRSILALLQLTGWVLAGIVVAELLEQFLRRRSSFVLRATLSVVLVASASLLVQVGQVARDLTMGALPLLGHSISALLAGGTVALGWHIIAAISPFAVLALLLVASKLLADRHAALPPRARQTLTLARPVTVLARVLAPRAPASLAKELGHTIRVLVLWIGHVWLFIVSAMAFSGQNPPLLAATFLLWMGAAYNILGADVPMGGLARYALLPRSLERTLAVRHAAIIASGTLIVFAALFVVGALGGLHHTGTERAAPIAYVLWYVYGASLFLLCTIPGDWFSQRQPRPVMLRAVARGGMGAGRIEDGILWFVTYAGTIIASAALFLAWSVAVGGMSGQLGAPGRLLIAVLLTSLTQYGLYAYRHHAGTRH